MPSAAPSYGYPLGWAVPPRVEFSGMAITAFVLSLFVFPAGLALGILALARLGVRHQRGKGLAIAAVVIASAQIVALSVIVPVVVHTAEDDSGDSGDGEHSDDALPDDRPQDPGPEAVEIDVFDIRVGDCFDSGVGLEGFGGGAQEMTVTRLPCDSPHEAEAYGLAHVEGYDAFPGEEELREISIRECDELLQDYILDTWTLPYEVFPYYYYPVAESWQFGDREILCFLGHDEGPELTETLRGDAGALGPEQSRYLEITTPLELSIWDEPGTGERLSERREWAADMVGDIEREITELSAGSWSGEVAELVPSLVEARELSLRHWRAARDAADVAAFEEAVDSGYTLLGVDWEIAIRESLGLTTGG
ncbi:DUF4190 domain-containing protein [Streptomyces sp. NBC_01803]|uniref:DUF4190 domain-containing protein n=1 Tax=Streptomyces sp. NBC_01803 TaxID=2975946 RepID=UPI002DDC3E44|nr:DUF4190 domain-containing protein [Streptomyces sp. NBC_01803]WSA46633.1 DUF4190 domain-containing protein [Streptomyces sp. NBC_01803]